MRFGDEWFEVIASGMNLSRIQNILERISCNCLSNLHIYTSKLSEPLPPASSDFSKCVILKN